jgi:hypothetical protein
VTDEQIKNKINRLIERLEFAELRMEMYVGLTAEKAKDRLKIISNIIKGTIKDLVNTAKIAREKELPIPQKLSYWMIDYVVSDFNGGKTSQLVKAAKTYTFNIDEMEKDSNYVTIVYEIIHGFKRGSKHKSEGVKPEVTGNLTMLTIGKTKKKLDTEQYGYLLAQTKKKLVATDVKKYFFESTGLIDSEIKRLFIRLSLNEIIKMSNQSLVAK